jgi:hypothetical protein
MQPTTGMYNRSGVAGWTREKNSMKSLSNIRTVSFFFET